MNVAEFYQHQPFGVCDVCGETALHLYWTFRDPEVTSRRCDAHPDPRGQYDARTLGELMDEESA